MTRWNNRTRLQAVQFEWGNEPQPRVVRLVSESARVDDPVRVTVASVEGEGRIEASSPRRFTCGDNEILSRSDDAHVDTGNRRCVPASCSSPCELRRRCALRASPFADRHYCRDVGAWQQCQNGCGDIGAAFTVGDCRFPEILRDNRIREPRISTKRKHLQDVSVDCGFMIARRCEHRGARQSHRCDCNVTSRGDGRCTCVVARHCRQRITARQHIVPREAVGTARIGSKQRASPIKIHSLDRAIDVRGRGAQRD